MHKIATELDYELVMVSNQDGLGTNPFPEEDFLPIHKHILEAFENEGVHFQAVHIDKSTVRKKICLPASLVPACCFTIWMKVRYNIKDSFVIGDRITDVQLAKNLGLQSHLVK